MKKKKKTAPSTRELLATLDFTKTAYQYTADGLFYSPGAARYMVIENSSFELKDLKLDTIIAPNVPVQLMTLRISLLDNYIDEHYTQLRNDANAIVEFSHYLSALLIGIFNGDVADDELGSLYVGVAPGLLVNVEQIIANRLCSKRPKTKLFYQLSVLHSLVEWRRAFSEEIDDRAAEYVTSQLIINDVK